MAAQVFTTPVTPVNRTSVSVLIRNKMVMNRSLEFGSDCEMMDTDSPVRRHISYPVSKKLFHSPLSEETADCCAPFLPSQRRRTKKRKQVLLCDSEERMKKVYITERKGDGCNSPCEREGMRRKVLTSLFHNKEYSMEFGS